MSCVYRPRGIFGKVGCKVMTNTGVVLSKDTWKTLYLVLKGYEML